METTSRGSLVKWPVAALIGLGFVGAFVIYALTVYLPDLVYSRVRAEAEAAGIELQHCEGFEFKRDGLAITHVSLKQCDFLSPLPMKPAGSVEQLDIDLANNVPTRVAIVGTDVTVMGELQLLQLQSEINPPAGVELTAQGSRISWIPEVGGQPQVRIMKLQRLGAEEPWSGDLALGEVAQGHFLFGKELTADLALRANSKNAVRLRVNPRDFFGTVRVDFDGLPMTLLSGVLFHNVPPELLTVQVTGSADFELPFGLNPKQPKGRFKLSFEGLNFPVPREVAGLIYDTSPEIDGDIAINRTFTKFKVDNLKFVTGSLRMKGSASIDRDGLDTHWQSTLQGPLPCTAIASAAAQIHLRGLPLGPELASAASRIAKQALKGSVAIIVALDARSTDLSAAKLVKTIGVGCGLKPLPLAGAAQDLLKDLPQLSLGTGSIADMLKELPTLPTLPQLPRPPLLGRKKLAEPALTSQ